MSAPPTGAELVATFRARHPEALADVPFDCWDDLEQAIDAALLDARCTGNVMRRRASQG